MKVKKRVVSPLLKKVQDGFRGFPLATIAYYGPDNTRASKVAICFKPTQDTEVTAIQRYFSETGDVRRNPNIETKLLRFIQEHGAISVIASPGIIGCPHEEGIDYPDGEECPQCPYWENRDRWTGEPLDPFAKAKALADWARKQTD